MGFIGSLFGGGSSTTVAQTSSTNVEVTVNPQIGVGVEVDTAPIGDAINASLNEFSAASERTGELIASSLSQQAVATAAATAGQADASAELGKTQAAAVSGFADRVGQGIADLGFDLQTGFILAAAGFGLFLLLKRRA